MSPIASSDLDKIATVIASSMQQGFAQLTAALSQPKAAMPAQAKTSYKYGTFLPKGAKADATSLAAKDQRIVNAFARKGFSVTLMDRNDPTKPFDVRPFKGWLDQGRIVRKGQKGVKGLFHVTQTDPLPSAKPAKGKAKKA